MTDDLERRLRKVRAFLNGEAPLYGHWFGVSVPSVEGHLCAFWWRQYLACMTEAADELARLRAENEALREALRPVADVDFLGPEPSYQDDDLVMISVGSVRRARTALQEGSRHE